MWIGAEDDRQAEQQRQQRQAGDRHVDREDVAHRLAQIVVDAPAEPDGADDRAEIVVEQHDRRGLARHVGAAAAHGDADMRGLERRRVVDAVAGHRDDLAVGLERVDDAQLLLGHDAGEDGSSGGPARPAPDRSAVSSSVAGHDVLGVEPGLCAR